MIVWLVQAPLLANITLQQWTVIPSLANFAVANDVNPLLN